MAAESKYEPSGRYHAHEAWGRSTVWTLQSDPDPQEFYRRHIAKTKRFTATPAMEFGTQVHSWILEGVFEVTPIPSDVLASNGARRGKKWDEFAERHAGETLLKPDEFALLSTQMEEIKERVMGHPYARLVAENSQGDIEQSIYWTDDETGLQLKCRPDKRTAKAIFDLKTTSMTTTEAIARQIESGGYYMQAAWYREGVYQLTGEWLPFVFVFVRSSDPWTVTVVDLDEDWLEAGRRKMRELLCNLMVRLETDNWQPSQHIETLMRPRWASFKAEYQEEVAA